MVIKTPKLRPSDICDDHFIEAFAHEAGISQLVGSHGNVVPFIGAVFNPPHLHLVNTWMTGGTVENLIKQNRYASSNSTDIEKVMKIAVDVAEGLKWMHERGVIHRDIASRNILLDEQERAW